MATQTAWCMCCGRTMAVEIERGNWPWWVFCSLRCERKCRE